MSAAFESTCSIFLSTNWFWWWNYFFKSWDSVWILLTEPLTSVCIILKSYSSNFLFWTSSSILAVSYEIMFLLFTDKASCLSFSFFYSAILLFSALSLTFLSSSDYFYSRDCCDWIVWACSLRSPSSLDIWDCIASTICCILLSCSFLLWISCSSVSFY